MKMSERSTIGEMQTEALSGVNFSLGQKGWIEAGNRDRADSRYASAFL